MSNINRRLEKAEKQLGVGQKLQLVNIAGLEITSDELDELLKEIRAESKGLPVREGAVV
jgi:hypothetical protein